MKEEEDRILNKLNHESAGLIHEWKFIDVNENNRLYYKKISECSNGFYFYGVEQCGLICDIKDPEDWDKERAICGTIFEGVAYFDGVRHIYFGNEKEDGLGYLNYPNIDNIILLLNELKKLEIDILKESE